MKKINISILFFILIAYSGKAQVKDISFTISPAAEYTWWDDKAGLEDNVLVGGKLGFGFGEYLELRGIYMQSLGQNTSFEDFGLSMYDASSFNSQKLDITRWGGEFKANIGTSRFKPYVTLGTGVQTLSLENGPDFEQIYATGGLGITFNIAKRFVFSLEGKNTTFKFNSGANLLSADNKAAFGVTDADFDNERLSNWSVQGSLQIYLGGRKPGVLTDLDKAYIQKFKGGLKGLQLIIEPGVAYTSFDNNSLLRDTYWLGGFAGVDFNEYVGVRGFYFQAGNDGNLSAEFDKLSMYGAEFRARLNDGNGVVPFLILGGGYLNPSDDYVTSTAVNNINLIEAESGGFASGGLGLNIPLGKRVLISGGARAMFTSGDNVTDINNTDDIQTNIFYNVGLKFTIGKKSKEPSLVYEENVERLLSEQQAINDERLNALKLKYTIRIKELERELKIAYDTKNVNKAVEILEEKKVVEDALQKVKDIENVQEQQIEDKVMQEAVEQDKVVIEEKRTAMVNDTLEKSSDNQIQPKKKSELIQMTPLEFESLIARILKGLDAEEKAAAPMPTLNLNPYSIEGNQQRQMEYLNERIGILEKLLLEVNQNNSKLIETDVQADDRDKANEMSQKILEKLDALNRKIDNNTLQINEGANKDTTDKTIIITPSDKEQKIILDENGNVIKEKKEN